MLVFREASGLKSSRGGQLYAPLGADPKIACCFSYPVASLLFAMKMSVVVRVSKFRLFFLLAVDLLSEEEQGSIANLSEQRVLETQLSVICLIELTKKEDSFAFFLNE